MLEVKSKPTNHSQGASAAAPARVTVDHADSRATKNGGPNTSSQFRDFQTKLPAITGEVHFKGTMAVDGQLNGNIGAHGGTTLKQRLSPAFASEPELVGSFTFKDMVRINGHIAGSVHSKNGTIIIDVSAKVDARVDVAVAVIGGTVTGDIIARERVELGPTSKISGNIWTRSIVIKDGAIFDGVCRMIEEYKDS
jgi:cytoskeletal protein CcmA (bactofilin family)